MLVTLVGLPLIARAAETPTFVQTAGREIRSGPTNSVAFNAPNTAGNLIVVYVVWGNTGAVTVADSAGNSYASAGAPVAWFSNQWRAQVFYAKNVAAGPNTVTATYATSINNYGLVYIHEYSGIDKVNPLDVTAAAAGQRRVDEQRRGKHDQRRTT